MPELPHDVEGIELLADFGLHYGDEFGNVVTKSKITQGERMSHASSWR